MKRRRFITKRTCIVLMLLLVGGAIVNVVVACAVNLSSGSDSDIYSRSWTSKRSAADVELIWLNSIGRKKPQDTECFVYSIRVCDSGAFGFHQHTFHEHIEPMCPGRHLFYGGPFAARTSVGWPLPTFSDEIRDMRAGGFIAVSGFEHAFGYSLNDDAGRSVPYRPIALGFAINTVFYAVILWALFAAPAALRRRRRIKRGWCPKCAYDLRGASRAPDSKACSECGAASECR